MAKKIKRLLVIGLGLIGGSLAKAAKDRNLYDQIIGSSRDYKTLDEAIKTGIIDKAVQDIEDIATEMGDGDLVVIAVPTLAIPAIISQLQPLLSELVTITDVASVKGSVVEAVNEVYRCSPSQFVPGHPIAGSEKSGIGAVDAFLFENHQVILTPSSATGCDHIDRVKKLWIGVGASVSEMKVVDHDEILAATSHLPHILAYALVDMLSSMRKNQEVFRYAAGGFGDFTRIAASDPVMWHDIVMANKKAITSALGDLTKHIDFIKQAISLGDSEYLLDVFAHARETRNHFDQMRENKTYLKPIAQTVDYRVSPGGCIKGKVVVPGDKSISHRAIILGSIANGVTNISGFLEGEDSLATLQAFRDMGVVIKRPAKGCVEVHGVGLNGLQAPSGPLYLGNSGTSMRLLSGLLAAQSFDVVLTGDESLSKRPMERVVSPLRKMGAVIAMNKNGLPPLKIKGGVDLKAIDYKLPMASAQVKSCILLAGLYAKGQTSTIESVATRDHTERMLAGFGYHVDRKEFSASLRGKGELKSTIVNVPADISSAAFYMVAASIAPGSDVILPHVGVNPTRIGVINILQMMGADIRLSNKKEVSGEPVADIQVRYAPLHGIEIPVDQVALAIDEFPVLFVAAACATGKTILRGALELRVKESDRIQSMADGLTVLGIDVTTTPDGIEIEGGSILGGE
ncbi:MAG: bifunctional prephenate dehydrogenase/3-phosphoshikimate 1-carboxyvinyltransferase, partial [Porticoccus sp.]